MPPLTGELPAVPLLNRADTGRPACSDVAGGGASNEGDAGDNRADAEADDDS